MKTPLCILGVLLAVGATMSACGDDRQPLGGGNSGGSDCLVKCGEAQECPNGDASIDCKAVCAKIDEGLAASQCSSEGDAYLDCVTAGGDSCEIYENCFTVQAELIICGEGGSSGPGGGPGGGGPGSGPGGGPPGGGGAGSGS